MFQKVVEKLLGDWKIIPIFKNKAKQTFFSYKFPFSVLVWKIIFDSTFILSNKALVLSLIILLSPPNFLIVEE